MNNHGVFLRAVVAVVHAGFDVDAREMLRQIPFRIFRGPPEHDSAAPELDL